MISSLVPQITSLVFCKYGSQNLIVLKEQFFNTNVFLWMWSQLMKSEFREEFHSHSTSTDQILFFKWTSSNCYKICIDGIEFWTKRRSRQQSQGTAPANSQFILLLIIQCPFKNLSESGLIFEHGTFMWDHFLILDFISYLIQDTSSNFPCLTFKIIHQHHTIPNPSRLRICPSTSCSFLWKRTANWAPWSNQIQRVTQLIKYQNILWGRIEFAESCKIHFLTS